MMLEGLPYDDESVKHTHPTCTVVVRDHKPLHPFQTAFRPVRVLQGVAYVRGRVGSCYNS